MKHHCSSCHRGNRSRWYRRGGWGLAALQQKNSGVSSFHYPSNPVWWDSRWLTDLRHRANLLSASILKHGAFWSSDGDWRHKARDRHKLKITLTISLSSQRGGTWACKGEGFKRHTERDEAERRRGRDMSAGDNSLKMNLGLLQSQEQERVLEVLRRDKQLRTIEENRIRWGFFNHLMGVTRQMSKSVSKLSFKSSVWKISVTVLRRMKHDLQELRRRGAKSYTRQYGEQTCARCQRPLGKFWNSGAVCHGCSHRICSRCRVGVGTEDWRCTVCHAYRLITFLTHCRWTCSPKRLQELLKLIYAHVNFILVFWAVHDLIAKFTVVLERLWTPQTKSNSFRLPPSG